MNWLEFIFGIIALSFLFVCFIAYMGIKYDTQKLEKENEELRESLRKAKLRKSKKEEN